MFYCPVCRMQVDSMDGHRHDAAVVKVAFWRADPIIVGPSGQPRHGVRLFVPQRAPGDDLPPVTLQIHWVAAPLAPIDSRPGSPGEGVPVLDLCMEDVRGLYDALGRMITERDREAALD